MQMWNVGCEGYGGDSASFYGAQDNYYYADKGFSEYGQNQPYPQQYEPMYNSGPAVVPAVGNVGYPLNQQQAAPPPIYQPYVQQHQQQQQVHPPVAAPQQMAPAYMEQSYPLPDYPPCVGPPGGPWNFGYCYGFYGEAPCPYVDVIDMEDFM